MTTLRLVHKLHFFCLCLVLMLFCTTQVRSEGVSIFFFLFYINNTKKRSENKTWKSKSIPVTSHRINYPNNKNNLIILVIWQGNVNFYYSDVYLLVRWWINIFCVFFFSLLFLLPFFFFFFLFIFCLIFFTFYISIRYFAYHKSSENNNKKVPEKRNK